MIFCDLSTPKGTSDKAEELKSNLEMDDFSEKNIVIYEEIKKMLQSGGITREEVAFIHDAKTKEQKLRLIDAVNEGKIRILIGSTSKLGAGTNAQKRLVALHHLDCPWRPRDIEQREGRILRQGNMNDEVEIFTYVTKGSYDANMWEKIKNKAMIISQAMSSNLVQRKIEDMDAAVLSYAEAEALASGNPLMAEKTLVDADVIKYSMLSNEYNKHLHYNERRLEKLPKIIQNIEKVIEDVHIDIKQRKVTEGEYFSATIGNKIYAKRLDAENALKDIAEHMDFNENMQVGEMGGFALYVYKGYSEIKIKLVGRRTYEAKSDSIRSAEYAAMNMPEALLAHEKEELQWAQKELLNLREEIERPFEYKDKLEKLLVRQSEIVKEIDLQVESVSNQESEVENSIDALSKMDLPEKIYKAYAHHLQMENPQLGQENLDRSIVHELNHAGYSERKIKECMAYSVAFKNLIPDQKFKQISRLVKDAEIAIGGGF